MTPVYAAKYFAFSLVSISFGSLQYVQQNFFPPLWFHFDFKPSNIFGIFFSTSFDFSLTLITPIYSERRFPFFGFNLILIQLIYSVKCFNLILITSVYSAKPLYFLLSFIFYFQLHDDHYDIQQIFQCLSLKYHLDHTSLFN